MSAGDPEACLTCGGCQVLTMINRAGVACLVVPAECNTPEACRSAVADVTGGRVRVIREADIRAWLAEGSMR